MEILNSSRSYSELYVILNILGNNFIKMLPEKLYSLIVQERDKEYNPNLLMDDGRLDESKLSNETIALFAVLNHKYFVQDEKEKDELLKKYKDNKLNNENNEINNSSKVFENKINTSYNSNNSNNIVNKYSNSNNVINENNKEFNNVISENSKAISNNNTALIEHKESFIKKLFKKIKNLFKREKWEKN